MTTRKLTDWRGTELEIGQTVVYGRGVSRSISPCVGTITDLHPSDGERRSFGNSWSDDKVSILVSEAAFGYTAHPEKPVKVMPERITVIAGLPENDSRPKVVGEKAK